MRVGRDMDAKVAVGLLVTIGVQLVAMLIWIGGAAERLSVLERHALEMNADHVRLARLETRLNHIQDQLDRIEARLEGAP